MKAKTRKNKLILLKKYLDLETNELYTNLDSIGIYAKVLIKNLLDKRIRKCHRCKKLNIKSYTYSVLGWGNLNADIFLIGESPCVHSMSAQFPFPSASGNILDIVLTLSNLTRGDVFISNSIHCHLNAKQTPNDKEIHKCNTFLQNELEIVRPKMIVTLGNSAKTALAQIKTFDATTLHKTHPAKFLYSSAGLSDYILKFSLDIDKVIK